MYRVNGEGPIRIHGRNVTKRGLACAYLVLRVVSLFNRKEWNKASKNERHMHFLSENFMSRLT